MKHPHCNRSHGTHLFWCRGFAPIFFILAVALIVVSVGSGIYFSVSKKTSQAPTPQDMVVAPMSKAESVVLSTTTAGITPSDGLTSATTVAVKPVVEPMVDCQLWSDPKVASQCLAEHMKTCAPARGTVVDPDSGMTVERIIDGYKGDKCSYRTNIISGIGPMAILAGMNINCMIPKATLSKTMQGGSMTQEDMLSLCSGTFIDLIRAQQASTQ